MDNEAAHRSRLEKTASRFDRLDDCTPSDYYSHPVKNKVTVDKIVDQREAEARNARLHKLLKAVGLWFSLITSSEISRTLVVCQPQRKGVACPVSECSALLESSRLHGARVDDTRVKRGQRVQRGFLAALRQKICTISNGIYANPGR